MEGILRRSIEIENLLFNGGNTVENTSWERDIVFNGFFQVFNSLKLWEKVHLSVGSPENDDLFVSFLAVPDISSNELNDLFISTFKYIVYSVTLISSNVFWIEGCFHWNNLREITFEFVDQIWFENMGAFACFKQVVFRDIPSSYFHISWVDCREQVFDWLIDILNATLWQLLDTNLSSTALSETSVVVWSMNTSLALPSDLVLVSQESCNKSRSIVSTKSNKHESKLWYSGFSLNSMLH
mmetsp:Transcript_29592/g.29179  ORF Transcript_29592/g.29179 Transcript_29592/m.29179 type:complete len:240 (+) Transcript_29592:444-1163(+)